jgi:ABC-type glycerol-3-phosphate transport system substrate-binding protein
MPQNWTDWEAGQAFLSGNLIMGPFTSAAIAYGEQNLPWTLGVAQMPSMYNTRCTVISGSALVNFSKKKKKHMAVNDFILWLVNKKNTIETHKFGYIPVRHSALKSIECMVFDSANPNYRIPIESLAYARPLPHHPELYKINMMIREMLNKIILGEADLLTVLRDTEIKINDMIE